MSYAALLAVLFSATVAFADAPASCPFTAGALPAQTLERGQLHGAQIPVDNIVVLMQENRSFDHYFGQLHYEGQRRAEGEPRNASNPDPTNPSGPPIRAFHQSHTCEVADLNHGWDGTHHEVNGGAMDGFTAQNIDDADPTGHRTMGVYDTVELPFYYALYKTFAMGDRYFCSVLGPTFPNRYYFLAGTSFGHISNEFPPDTTQFTQRSIFNLLDEADPPVTWKIYWSILPFGDLFAYVRNERQANVVPIAQFFDDAQHGVLPQVSFVDPIFVGLPNVENDEHPPANVQVGEKFVSDVIGALFASPQWGRSALFVNYDEHGGFYDHVPPPAACVPDGIPPNLGPDDVNAAFDRYGIRVPVVVVSPFSRRHYVSHVVHDHTSVLRFIETRFDLPALTARDANADPMLEFFNFGHPGFRNPPALPAAYVNPVEAAACGTTPPASGDL
jgi:phospholipase C